MKLIKIVITGGPCAGKSEAMTWIKNTFTKEGYGVIFVSETATELITGGIAPWTMKSPFIYQLYQMRLQIENEKIYCSAAENILQHDKVIIVFDRGMADNLGYMSSEDFNKALKLLNINDVYSRYDAVFHLVTAAKGAREDYTTDNNLARTETPDEAAALDDRLINAWKPHQNFNMIDVSDNFCDKMRCLIEKISIFLEENM
ncbi:MAG: ATP-binding protein [Clostridia bacterium]|nr:ATP-binding protein [Clostridia bacterium]